MSTWFNSGVQLIKKMNTHRVTGLAAEQAFYYLLSMFPLLILLLSILPYMSINPQIISNFTQDFIPKETSKLVEETVFSVLSERNSSLLTFGIVGTIWSASNGINAFIHSMNIAFDVKETRNYLMNRFLAIIMTFGLICAFIIALILPVFGNVILKLVDKFLPISYEIQNSIHVLRWVIAIIIISIILAFLYKIAPNVHISIKHVLVGAVIAAILWILVSLGFSFYVNNFGNYSATYGSLGGVMVLMLWLYLTGLSLIIGGEINAFLYRNIYFSHTKKTIGQFLSQKRMSIDIFFLYAFTYSSNLSSKFSQAPNRRFIYRSASWKDLKD